MEMGIWLLFIPFPVLRFGAVSSPPEIKKAALPITPQTPFPGFVHSYGNKNVQMDSVQATGKTQETLQAPSFYPPCKSTDRLFYFGILYPNKLSLKSFGVKLQINPTGMGV